MISSEELLKERAAVVAEAKTWIGTPYHHRAALKGVGADCATILTKIYPAALPWCKDYQFNLPNYSMDWHLHRSDEMYLKLVEVYANEVPEGKPGDIVVFKFGRSFSHGGIIIEWPTIVHALLQARCVMIDDASINHDLVPRERKFFSPWMKQYGIS